MICLMKLEIRYLVHPIFSPKMIQASETLSCDLSGYMCKLLTCYILFGPETSIKDCTSAAGKIYPSCLYLRESFPIQLCLYSRQSYTMARQKRVLTFMPLSCQAFETMLIRDALKHGCYELQKARDAWRVAVGPDGMDADLVQHYIEVL